MRRFWTRRILLLAVPVVVATACGDDGGGGPEVSLDPGSGPPGTEIAVEVSGCDNPSGGSLLVGDQDIATISFDDAETGSVTVPEDAELGEYRVVVICRSNPEETDQGVTESLEDAEATFEVVSG